MAEGNICPRGQITDHEDNQKYCDSIDSWIAM